ncbi:MAG: phosphatase domain-containing protein [Bacteroidota bacterium]
MKKNKYIIQVYTAFVTSSHLYVKGRVLKDKSPISFVNQGPISSLFNTILRMNSRELPNIDIHCIFGDRTFEVVTDYEGYFEIFHNISEFSNLPNSIRIESIVKGEDIRFDQPLRMYLYDVPFGIISDIDDTILVSGVRSFFKLRLFFNTIFINPFRRKPITHAAEAYHHLLNRFEGESPIVYVSNSPWNIFDYLQAFLEHNVFPVGEVILRDMGTQLLKSRDITEYNKYLEIEKVLIALDSTKFTLIGDTGEKDFDIYLAIHSKYPERISRIILHNAGNSKKIEEIKNYILNSDDEFVTIVDDYKELII